MKKIYIFALISFSFISCDKNEITESQVQSEANRLEFTSRDEVQLAIQALDEGSNCDILLNNPNFINFTKAKVYMERTM